ncbi:MAG: alpha-amylase/4-alpha-glucanotransferase domain-containing protein, partial [Deferribacterota bacterium]|nr:alpha-amylase/4-alpha-glucanotransferase domain-containing protein [Deferribacterota bacterium]
LTERVWDPSIIPDLVNCGIEYVVIDDYHFLSTGYKQEDLYSYYITEHEGFELKIFPIDKTLRYIVPFKRIDNVLDYLKSISQKGSALGIIFDDGEKFGVWPGTHDWVYKQGWLNQFLDALSADDDVESVLFKDIVSSSKPMGIAYLPTTSYFEMGEWSLFADTYELFDECLSFLEKHKIKERYQYLIKGGIWKNFLSKYSEANHIHKRLTALSKKILELESCNEIKESLLKAECNDVLWHGIFGGLYLPNLRNNTYKFIIEAESAYNKYIQLRYPSIDIYDLNMDGYNEAIMTSEDISAIFSSKYNGQMIELDVLKEQFNLNNTLTRRKEGYHKQILEKSQNNEPKEGISTIHEMDLRATDELKKYLIYDWHPRHSFIDHFSETFNIDDFYYMRPIELGDFVNKEATLIADELSVTFKREGGIYKNNCKHNTSIKKTYLLEKNIINEYIEIDTDYQDELYYTVEFNFHFYHLENILVNNINASTNNSAKGKIFKISDGVLNKTVNIELNDSSEIFWYFVNTVYQTEKGASLLPQAICLLIPFKFKNSLKNTLKLYLDNINV